MIKAQGKIKSLLNSDFSILHIIQLNIVHLLGKI